ncbi:hypothetical protein CTEN210_12449 [Chaetoceros tenuissimus]|uniref:SUN domain-containing protein n=1 Tax=Chaetoceros tenuissimus TaxID=426638 RepID=A0AAD3D1B2_9STRA|nr:hypothetical protein CTEN210_12449 [Chaetoceros tenuissimus]
MRVRSIALLSLLSVIPLSANDELVDPVQNDILTVHEDEMKASTQEIIADESVAADTVHVVVDDSENDDEGASSTNQQAQHEIVKETTEEQKNKITETSDDTEKNEATENNIEENIQEPSNLDKQDTTELVENKSENEDSTEETNEIDQDETAGNQEEEEKDATEAEDSNENDTAPSSEHISENAEEDEDKTNIAIDYSSKSTGALIIDKSKNFKGTSNLLNPDKDKYAMIPCDQGDAVKYVTIGLSEDILVKTIKLVSNERYSSLTKRFQVLGSQDMSTWEDMGTFDAKPWYKENKQQTFELESPSWARYLKFRFLDHYGDEHYCAYTQISVFGSTTLQGYQEMQMEANEAAEAESEAAKAVVDEIESAALGELENLESDESTNNEINIPDEELEQRSEENSDVAETELTSAENEIVDISEQDQSMDTNSATVVEEKKPEVEEIATEVKEQKAHTTEDSSVSSGAKVETPESKSIEGATEESDEVPVELESTEKVENNNEVVEESKATPQVKNEVTSGESADQTKPPESENVTDSTSSKEKEAVVSSAPVASAVKSAIQSVRKSTIKESTTETNDEDMTHKPEVDKGKDNEDSEINEEVKAVDKSEPKATEEESTTNVTNEVKNNAEEVVEPEPPTVQTAKTLEDTPEESQPPKLNSSSTATSSVSANIDSSSNDVLKATEEVLSSLSKKYPNAKCLNYLDFSEFKKRSIESAKQKLSAGDKTKIQGNKNEPIFKKLTDEIKGLQASQGVYEQYIKAATSCYQRVILDLGNDLVLKQKEHEDRVTAIEDQMKQFLQENQSSGLGIKDLVHGTKSTLKPLYNFLIRTFPVLVSCYQYLKIVFLSTLEKILENEHVQRALALLQSYERDIKTFAFGMLCCYMYFLSTSTQKKRKSKETKKRRRVPRITAPHTPQKIHGLVVQNGEILSSPSLHDDRSD